MEIFRIIVSCCYDSVCLSVCDIIIVLLIIIQTNIVGIIIFGLGCTMMSIHRIILGSMKFPVLILIGFQDTQERLEVLTLVYNLA